jgi:hypothetical protein
MRLRGQVIVRAASLNKKRQRGQGSRFRAGTSWSGSARTASAYATVNYQRARRLPTTLVMAEAMPLRPCERKLDCQRATTWQSSVAEKTHHTPQKRCRCGRLYIIQPTISSTILGRQEFRVANANSVSSWRSEKLCALSFQAHRRNKSLAIQWLLRQACGNRGE